MTGAKVIDEDEEEYRPAPVRLRALSDLQVSRPGADGGVETLTVAGGDTFRLDPGAPGHIGLMQAAYRLLSKRRAEVVGARPGWLPKLTCRLRAIGTCPTPSGLVGPGALFEKDFESIEERETVLWGVNIGQWELAGDPPPSWPEGHIRSTRVAAIPH